MGRTQEPGGDYGYDLVHEEVRSTDGRPADPADSAPPATPDDGAGDHGYDEAHDF
jgi:hypothetical protein